jgi:hypothetical protein
MISAKLSRGWLILLGIHLCVMGGILLPAYIFVSWSNSQIDRYFTIEDFAKVSFPLPVSQTQTHVEVGAVFAHFQTDSDGLSSFLQESGFASPETGCWSSTITPLSPPDWWREECVSCNVSHVADRHGGIICRQVLIVGGAETIDVYLAAALCDNP